MLLFIHSYVEHLLEILTSGGIGIDGIEQVKVLSISENNVYLKMSHPSKAKQCIESDSTFLS